MLMGICIAVLAVVLSTVSVQRYIPLIVCLTGAIVPRPFPGFIRGTVLPGLRRRFSNVPAPKETGLTNMGFRAIPGGTPVKDPIIELR